MNDRVVNLEELRTHQKISRESKVRRKLNSVYYRQTHGIDG